MRFLTFFFRPSVQFNHIAANTGSFNTLLALHFLSVIILIFITFIIIIIHIVDRAFLASRWLFICYFHLGDLADFLSMFLELFI